MQYMSWKRHSSICLPLPFVLYICLMHCRDLWRFFFQLPEWLTHQIWTSAQIGQKTRKQGSCTLFKQKSWKKNFPGIALEMVGEPKITKNFIIWREKKTKLALFWGKNSKKRRFFKNLHIFVILRAKTKVMKRNNTFNEFDKLFYTFSNFKNKSSQNPDS